MTTAVRSIARKYDRKQFWPLYFMLTGQHSHRLHIDYMAAVETQRQQCLSQLERCYIHTVFSHWLSRFISMADQALGQRGDDTCVKFGLNLDQLKKENRPRFEAFSFSVLYLTTRWLMAFLSTSLGIQSKQPPYIKRTMYLEGAICWIYAWCFSSF